MIAIDNGIVSNEKVMKNRKLSVGSSTHFVALLSENTFVRMRASAWFNWN